MELSYNGTRYHGWQIQPNAPTVQETIEKHISTLLREDIQVVGAGRTDTGVHASQMYLHFETEQDLGEDFVDRINRFLPMDIAFKNIKPVKSDAHTRFDAIQRTYLYYLHTEKNCFNQEVSFYFQHPLDLESMQASLPFLIGEKDFSCFSKSGTQTKTNICHVTFAEWRKDGSNWVFEIRANRFLRNMVRAIMGTQLEIGTGKLEPKELAEIIKSKKRSEAGASVPPNGLFLSAIEYPQEIFI